MRKHRVFSGKQTNTFRIQISYELTNISNVDALYLYPQVTARRGRTVGHEQSHKSASEIFLPFLKHVKILRYTFIHMQFIT